MIKYIVIGAIKSYQRIRALFALSNCRFHPSCSQYAIDAVNKFGPFKGTGLAIWRLMRCSPFSQGGHDPVR